MKRKISNKSPEYMKSINNLDFYDYLEENYKPSTDPKQPFYSSTLIDLNLLSIDKTIESIKTEEKRIISLESVEDN